MKNFYIDFSLFHFNLNSIAVHDFLKLFLLEPYNTQYKFDIFLSEAFYIIHLQIRNKD